MCTTGLYSVQFMWFGCAFIDILWCPFFFYNILCFCVVTQEKVWKNSHSHPFEYVCMYVCAWGRPSTILVCKIVLFAFSKCCLWPFQNRPMAQLFIASELCLACVVDDLGELLLGEAKLQQYLKENPIKQGASPCRPRPRLQEVRKHLTAALDRGNLKVYNCIKQVL